jgi:exonuclease SbcC
MEGFGAFRDRTEVDFDGADLFALAGPTGSGKTTVIDAICFALYGSIPRYDDKRLVAPAISQGLAEARVRFDFTVDGRAHTAVRVVKRTKTGATTKEARLEDGDGNVLAGNEKELTATVEAMLGLSYEHFTKCVVLPQGDFARFLHDKPDKRQELLVELLDLGVYGDMAALAHERAREEQQAVRTADDRLRVLADATPEARDEAIRRADELAALRVALDAAITGLQTLADRAAAARSSAEAANQRAADLAGVVVPDEVAALAGLFEAAQAEGTKAARAEDDCVEVTAKAEAQLLALRPRRELELVRASHDERIGHLEQQAKGASALTAAVAAEAAASAAYDQAVDAVEQAAASIERLQIEHAAHALRDHLTVGAPCPVCEQAVALVPSTTQVGDLDTARAAREQAASSRDRVAKELADAQRDRVRIEAKLASIAEQLAAIDGRLADEPAAAELDRMLAEVGAAERAVNAARDEERAARARRVAATKSLDEARDHTQRARRALHAAHASLAALGAPAPLGADLLIDWQSLATWAAAEAPAQRAAADAATAAAAALDAERAAAQEAIVDRCAAIGITARDAGDLRDTVVAAHTRAVQAIERIDEELAEAEQLRITLAAHAEREQVALGLHRHLGARGFEKWVLDEALHGLVQAATGTLLELSGGQYSLCLDERGFAVVDHRNADQVRSARSLSGGETFLASLALALALADQLARLAGRGQARLESLFLDEGFGTLDHDTLDTVAAAIDELGSRGRMVGLISHVAELADRVPVRFEIRKLANTSTIEKVLQ